jgi:preprotein translocase subunit SecG
MSIVFPILITLHVIVCVLMVLVVLMQRPRSEGLGSAFGGGLTDNVFGSQTTNVLARFTTWLAVAFFAITLLLSIITAKANSGKTEIQKKLLSEPVPEAASTPASTPALPQPEATPTQPEATPQAATPVVEEVQVVITEEASSNAPASDKAQPATGEPATTAPEPEAPVTPQN